MVSQASLPVVPELTICKETNFGKSPVLKYLVPTARLRPPTTHTPHEVSTVSQGTANLPAPTPAITVLNKEYLEELKASIADLEKGFGPRMSLPLDDYNLELAGETKACAGRAWVAARKRFSVGVPLTQIGQAAILRGLLRSPSS